jgi:hypothetical protein
VPEVDLAWADPSLPTDLGRASTKSKIEDIKQFVSLSICRRAFVRIFRQRARCFLTASSACTYKKRTKSQIRDEVKVMHTVKLKINTCETDDLASDDSIAEEADVTIGKSEHGDANSVRGMTESTGVASGGAKGVLLLAADTTGQ